jgi:hypothetical protein
LTFCSSVSDEKVLWTSSQYIRLFHVEPGVSMKLTIWFLYLIILFTCCTWQGVLKHGFGFWDDIFADTSLGFPDAIGVQGADGGVVPYPKPTPKACLKRVKFIANNLRRQLRKVKVCMLFYSHFWADETISKVCCRSSRNTDRPACSR